MIYGDEFSEFRVIRMGKYTELINDEIFNSEKDDVYSFCKAFDLPCEIEMYDKKTGWLCFIISCRTKLFFYPDIQSALKTFMLFRGFSYLSDEVVVKHDPCIAQE